MSGEGRVVRDEWWEMSGERWVVGDECVCDVLYEMSEMSSVRCLCMWYVGDEWWGLSGERWVVGDEWWEMSGGRWVCMWRDEWDEWCEMVVRDERCEMSGLRWVVWGEWCENGYPERRLHTARRQTRMPGTHQRKIFAPPIGTATPNTVYTQRAAKPACQEDTNAKFSHLLLAQLPRTQFTHSKLPNPHARKTPTQNFRTSYWHSSPEHSLHTARRQTRTPGRHHRNMFASPIGRATPTQQRPSGDQARRNPSGGSKYCACHADRSRGPAATRRAATPSRLPRTQELRHAAAQRWPGAPQPFLEAPSTALATQIGAAAQQRPGAPQHLLEAPSTAPATQTGAAAQRRPGAPQPLLKAPSIAPATQTGAAAQRRPGAPQPLSGGSKYWQASHTGDAAKVKGSKKGMHVTTSIVEVRARACGAEVTFCQHASPVNWCKTMIKSQEKNAWKPCKNQYFSSVAFTKPYKY